MSAPHLSNRRGAALLAGLLLAAAPALSQAVVTGVVSDTGGEPIAGATVSLTPVAPGPPSPPTVETDARGRWRAGPVAPGRWELAIRAVGFINVNGWVTVPSTGAPDPVEAQMLPLDWEPPSFGDTPHTLLLWIEKGNSLLEQGRPADARAIYERALAQLPPARRPEVLKGVARAYFLEGDVNGSIASLARALEIAPDDREGRQLYTMLMDNEGRAEEAASFLAALDARPPEESGDAEAGERPLPPPVTLPEDVLTELRAEPAPPLPGRVGAYKVRFAERSPHGGIEEYAARMGGSLAEIRAGDPDAGAYDLGEESFQVLAPHGYAPGAGWGLLVWLSPTPYGGTRSGEMAAALARHRLIWVGANHAGNQRPVWDRILLALDALHNMLPLYDLDPERIYVAGYSGGGRAASRIGVVYPELVTGVWSLYGCDYFRPLPLVERPGASWPAKYAAPPRERLERARRNRFVLVTGPRDFNFTQTRATAREMERDGFHRVTYVEIPGADHYTLPDGEWLDRIFAALDGADAGEEAPETASGAVP
ncbi:MAG: carboxypeptidase regulatory-like domain-containing protein [Thermoanaerobaculia bacterium]|nr:carboxypeptidase regulatory-like domain-containing protein [Thermoanaerobaculia bacterium]